MIVRDPDKLLSLEKVFPFYAETRPKVVRQIGIAPEGGWAVGPAPGPRVRWLFELKGDMETFKRRHFAAVLVAGYLGPH